MCRNREVAVDRREPLATYATADVLAVVASNPATEENVACAAQEEAAACAPHVVGDNAVLEEAISAKRLDAAAFAIYRCGTSHRGVVVRRSATCHRHANELGSAVHHNAANGRLVVQPVGAISEVSALDDCLSGARAEERHALWDYAAVRDGRGIAAVRFGRRHLALGVRAGGGMDDIAVPRNGHDRL